MSAPTVVFCGPTISKKEVTAQIDAICLPPAVQGSLVASVQAFNPRVIVLIDGSFQTEPAIKHKEIMWAASRGIVMIGASSMGALRAAELPEWMTGVGLIYRWYRRCVLSPDDAVAVLHAPSELGSRALTDALIDLRMTFKAAVKQGVISTKQCLSLSNNAQALNFRHRTLERVITETLPQSSSEKHADLISRFEACIVRQKHLDALEAIETVKQITVQSARVRHDFVMTRAFIDDIRQAGMSVTD